MEQTYQHPLWEPFGLSVDVQGRSEEAVARHIKTHWKVVFVNDPDLSYFEAVRAYDDRSTLDIPLYKVADQRLDVLTEGAVRGLYPRQSPAR